LNIIFDNVIFSIQRAGGISVYWFELIKYFLKNKNQINFLHYKNNNLFSRNLNLKKDLIINSRLILKKYERYLNPKKIKINKKTIFHSSYYRTLKLKNVINVTTVYDFTYEKKIMSIKKFVHIIQKRNSLFNADAIICISNSTKKDLLYFYPKLKEKMIKVIYISYDEKNYFFNRKLIRDFDQVLFVGARQGYKNFKTAVDAVSISDTIKLNIVGSDLTKSEIIYLNKKIGIKRYELFKYLSPQELNKLYNSSLCLLYLSEYEGFGIPILEAMASGCPVIVQKTSSIPEVAGEAGIYVKNNPYEVYQRVMDLKNHPNYFYKHQELGLKNVSKFSWKKSMKKTEQMYSELLKSTEEN
jgi:mannosyltransferase